MPYLGLDSVAENFTPQQIVNDMRSVNAKLIGLYAFNNDVPNPSAVVKTAAYVQELERLYGGPCVLPIITIRTGDSPDPAFLVQDLQQWFPGGGRRVAHDLENTAFPPLSEVEALFAAEKAARFSPGTYGFQSTQSMYAAANPDWQWGVQAYAEGFGYLPAPYSMWQWTDNVLNFTYDGNSVGDGFSVVTNPLPKEQDPMIVQSPNGTFYLLSGGLYVHITDQPSLAAFQAANLPQVTVTDAQHQALLASQPKLTGTVSLKGTADISGTVTAS